MNFYIPLVFTHGPAVVERAFRQIPRSRWDERIHADRFTPREVVAHLADWEPIMLGRMQSAYNSPGTTVEVFDEGQMAIDHGYVASDPEEQLELFRDRRGATWLWLQDRMSDLDRHFMHPERGPQTIGDHASLMISHDLYHIEQLSEYLG